MSTARIMGQDVSILIVQDGELQDTLTAISNFEGELEFEIISKGYLGEKTERKDMVFKGVKFNGELNPFTQDIFAFAQSVKDKAQRINVDTMFNVTGIFTFPNGDTPELLFTDCAFGPIPIGVGSRTDYVKSKFSGECSDVDIELSGA